MVLYSHRHFTITHIFIQGVKRIHVLLLQLEVKYLQEKIIVIHVWSFTCSFLLNKGGSASSCIHKVCTEMYANLDNELPFFVPLGSVKYTAGRILIYLC